MAVSRGLEQRRPTREALGFDIRARLLRHKANNLELTAKSRVDEGQVFGALAGSASDSALDGLDVAAAGSVEEVWHIKTDARGYSWIRNSARG
mmetsp:Transcript_25639/g.49921  ORF Transcript_25639/g.49921 Transcript_25639/m.49921 type:complete len:93 (+) Transcript_25639:578-856(+)